MDESEKAFLQGRSPGKLLLVSSKSTGGNLFDLESLEKSFLKENQLYPFTPDKHEPRFTVSQVFEDNVEHTLHFVIRDGKQLIFKQEKRQLSNAYKYKVLP